MEITTLYFAYGSNMNPMRMNYRCPGAVDLGGALLRNYKVTERLYADIDYKTGAKTHGVLYIITERHLRTLDFYEGYPSIYQRVLVNIEFMNNIYWAYTYKMSDLTKIQRQGLDYPEHYRQLCSTGASTHNIKNCFIK